MGKGVGIRVELGKERIEFNLSRCHRRPHSGQFCSCSNQYVIPISRYIVVAVVRCSCACPCGGRAGRGRGGSGGRDGAIQSGAHSHSLSHLLLSLTSSYGAEKM